MVGKHKIEAIDEIDGDVVGRSERGRPSVKRTGLGLVNVWNLYQVVSVDGQLLRFVEPKVVHSYAPRRPY